MSDAKYYRRMWLLARERAERAEKCLAAKAMGGTFVMDEHLLRTCVNCGYEWEEACAE